ncbi:SPFH domain-containing protein [Nocardiopsis synnemataformans]|uniref:SPFH domain-containing protein n=1 Tax=Nocardiopsis synnemataformans TaxID=61305 RepID=UPI003EBB7850
MTTPRRYLAALLTLVAAMALAGCSISTGPDQAGMIYNAGPLSSTTFDTCVDPGHREYHGPADQTYSYPAGQRTFTFSGADTADMATATVVSADDLELTVTGLVSFQLNTDCDVLRQFHEQIGLKYQAHSNAGWSAVLRDYIGQPLNRALDDATKSYNWRDLYTSADAKAEWEKEVGTLLATYIAEQGGDAYFISPTYDPTDKDKGKPGEPQLTLQQPTPPEEVRAALTQAQEAVEKTTAQEAENARVEAELEAIEDLVDVLGPEGYILYQALKDGRVDFLPVPSGGDINVTR